jgi:hypothetical protein
MNNTHNRDEYIPHTQMDFNFVEKAEELYKNGVTVYPLINPEETPKWRKRFRKTLAQFKTFKPTDNVSWRDGKSWYTMGGFGALGNPESFHNKLSAEFRKLDYDPSLAVIGTLALETDCDHKYFTTRFDRMQLKVKNSQVTRESFHRDEGPCEEGDLTFGGWVNLDSEPQYFSCVPGSHPHPSLNRNGGGFVKYSQEDIKNKVKVEVPSGCRILFFQDILHEIIAIKIKKDAYRLFLGSTISINFPQKLYDDQKQILDSQSLPKLPGGMFPPMYAAAHLNYHRKLLEDYSRDCINEKFLEEKVSKHGEKYTIVKRFIKTLEPKDRIYEYTPEDYKIMLPHLILI